MFTQSKKFPWDMIHRRALGKLKAKTIRFLFKMKNVFPRRSSFVDVYIQVRCSLNLVSKSSGNWRFYNLGCKINISLYTIPSYSESRHVSQTAY